IADRLRELDPATAATLNTIDLGLTIAGSGGEDLAFRSDGIGFLASGGLPDQLYRFDVTSPSATLLTGNFSPAMFGLAFNAADVFYGLVGGGSGLYLIDQVTGASTLVGPTGVSGLPRGGLAINAAGTAYAALGPLTGNSALYQINLSTGTATLVGDIGFAAVSGLAFGPLPPAPPPPPPSSSPPQSPPLGPEGS